MFLFLRKEIPNARELRRKKETGATLPGPVPRKGFPVLSNGRRAGAPIYHSVKEIVADEENALDCVVHSLDPGQWLWSGSRNPDANVHSYTYSGFGQSGTYPYAGAGATHPHAQADSYACPYPCS